MIGGMCSGSLIKYGKMKMMVATNGLLCFSIGVCMIQNIYFITIGRFIWGVCAGAFTVFSTTFHQELVPHEISGPLGGLPAFYLCFGEVIPACLSMGLAIDPKSTYVEDPSNFFVTQYWRVIWLIAGAIGFLQSALLLSCFRFETPKDMKLSQDIQGLETLLSRCYKKHEVKLRANMISIEESGSLDKTGGYW